jgi:hypothetical protein
MIETYLTLQGWIPHRLDIDGSVGLFLYNPHTHTVVNRNGVLYDEAIGEESYRMVELKIVSFSEIPPHIIDTAINLALG